MELYAQTQVLKYQMLSHSFSYIPTAQQVLQLIKSHLDTFGPGSYVSGSSLRSASTSLDGVVAVWSASVDAASLLPGGELTPVRIMIHIDMLIS